MFEVFHEETIGPIDADKVNRKYRLFSMISLCSLVVAIMFTVYTIFYINLMEVPDGVSLGDFFLLGVLPNLVITILFYVMYFFFRSKKNTFNVFYDYTFVSGELRIAKVLNGIKRKPVAKIQASDITVLGKTSSDNFLRYKSMKDLKNIVATPNVDVSENVHFMVCTVGGDRVLLLFEPSQTLLIHIKRFAGRTVDYV